MPCHEDENESEKNESRPKKMKPSADRVSVFGEIEGVEFFEGFVLIHSSSFLKQGLAV